MSHKQNHTHAHTSVESREAVTEGSKVKVACVDDALHLNQLSLSMTPMREGSVTTRMTNSWTELLRNKNSTCLSYQRSKNITRKETDRCEIKGDANGLCSPHDTRVPECSGAHLTFFEEVSASASVPLYLPSPDCLPPPPNSLPLNIYFLFLAPPSPLHPSQGLTSPAFDFYL